MAESKGLALANKLIRLTDQGALDWEETANPDKFVLSFQKNSITIERQWNQDVDEYDYYLSILGEDGRVIDTFSDVELTKEAEDGAELFRQIGSLYNQARRRALGADKAVEQVLEELDKIELLS